MENEENPLVPITKIKKIPKRWSPNGKCGLNSFKAIPHLLKQTNLHYNIHTFPIFALILNTHVSTFH